MDIDLSALEEKDYTNSEGGLGQPLIMDINKIFEDENQPRNFFDEVALKELSNNIALKGVKQPISVRPLLDGSLSESGNFIINFGARRYRASKLAGLDTIPVFIDEATDSFDQVIENEQRANLTTMELAIFVDTQIKKGIKKKEVAKMLSKKETFITEVLSLIDAPECINKVYRLGKTTSAKTIYELRKLYKKDPDRVELFCQNEEIITRASVKELSGILNGTSKNEDATLKTDSDLQDEFQFNEGYSPSADLADGASIQYEEQSNSDADHVPVTTLPYHNPEIEEETKQPKITDPDKIKKPLLLVEFDERSAMLMLNKRPSNPGLVWIKYEDDGVEDEIDSTKAKIHLLTESR